MSDPTPHPTANLAPQDPSKTKSDQAKDIAKQLGEVYGTSSSNGGTKDPLVYLGQNNLLQGEMRFTAGTNYYDKTSKLSAVANQYYNWDPKTKDKFLTQLNLAGYDTNNLRDDQVAQLWAGYAQQAAAYYAAGNKMTPWDILAKDRQAREAYMNTPRSVTQTSTNYQMSTREDAHALFLQAAQSLLGRDPTKSEISTFQKALNAYEKKNPTVTTTTSNYVGDQLKSQSSTSKGGVSENARALMAQEDIKKDPEYGAYQAATTYFDAMMQMIGGS